MAGSDQSAKLQGLLSGIADSTAGLGAGGEWASNAVRTAARPDFTSGLFGTPKFDMNNVDNLDAMTNWASRNGYEDQAKQYMALSYRQKEKDEAAARANRIQMGQSSVASLQNEYMRVLKDPAITDPTVRQQKLDNLQASMNAIAGAVDGMDPVKVGQIGQQAEAADLTRRERLQSMDLTAQANQRAWASFGLAEETAARAEAQHAEWVATADYRATERQIKQSEARYNQGVKVAKALVGTEGGKEKFLSNKNYADMEGVWNSVSRQVEGQELELQNARDQANKNKWTYTDTQLEELGISKDMRTKLTTLSETSPSSANQMVLRMLEQQYAVAEAPTAAMLGMFEGAALSHVQQNVDLKGRDTESKQEAKASELALKMAQKYMETNSIELALQVLSADSANEDVATSAFDANLQAIEDANAAALAAQQDAADPDR